MKLSRGAALLLVPGLGLFLVLLVLPLANVVEESFRLFEPGRIGAAKDAPYTLFNYVELAEPAYLYYFVETVRFGLVSSVIALTIAFPIAYLTARQPSPLLRRLAIGFLIGMMFLSTLVRVYALQLTFGPTGFARLLAGILDISPNGRAYTEMVVIFGLLHYLIPISAITLLGTVQNIDPRLGEAAQTLRRAALEGPPDDHRAAVRAGAAVGVPDLLHPVPERLRGADDPGQGQGAVRLQPDLRPVQRDRQLPERLGGVDRDAGHVARDHLRDHPRSLGALGKGVRAGTAMRRHLDDFGFLLILAILAVTLVFLVLPIVVSVMMSFDGREYLGRFPPPDYSVHWYARFFSDAYYLHGLKTSVIIALLATVVSTTAGVSAAIVLDRYEFPGKAALEALFLSPLVVPAVVIGFALLLFFALLGVFDGFTRLLAGHIIITFPYTVRTTLAGLVGIRKTLTEAAMSLGATERRAFWDITFPLARTGMIAGAVFAFAFSMDDVAVSLFLTSPDAYTLPVAMTSMMRTNFDLTIAAAAVVLMLFTVGLIFVLNWIVGIDRLIGTGVYRS